jgi:chemotaxis response regulator CheB
MRHPQVVVYESDGWLAGQIRRLAGENAWLVRESRNADTCLGQLADVRPSVLLLRLERELLDGLSLLGRVAEQAPACPVILVSDVKMESADQRAQLSALAMDLGARYILFPPLQTPVIEDLVSGLLTAEIHRAVGVANDGAEDA